MNLASIETAFALFVIVLLVQSLVLTIAIRKMNTRLKALDRGVANVNEKTTHSIQSVRETLAAVVPWTRNVGEWEGRIDGATHRLLNSAREGNQKLASGLARLHDGTRRADEKLNKALQTFSRYSFQVHQGVLHPSKQVAAVLESVTQGLGSVLSKGDQSMSPEFVAEEEEFI